MPTHPTTRFIGFTPEALSTLHVAGISERWVAIQQLLHPQLAALSEELDQAIHSHMPRIWSLYERNYKDARSINRGPSGRAPIDEYHIAIDRPPRGSGIYLIVSGIDQRIIIAIQLWGRRKPELRRIWEEGRAIWASLIERMDEVRFVGATPQTTASSGSSTWLDSYLAARNASYLLAGFSYRWDNPLVAQPAFAEQVIADVLALLPLNEALMEQVEQHEPRGVGVLREHSEGYLALPEAEVIVSRVRSRGLALPADTIRAYHLALQTRPFAILPGISGTGKTRLTRIYADAVYNIPAGRENEHYLLIAVQPDWHNARDLLGYYNAITGKFHATPLLQFLARAAAEPDAPYFVCLDEMNLARPEYYLAPILSALETDDRLIDLGAPGPEVETASGERLQNPFRLPRNLAITGTVNVDESTHALSDKLLDRANVIELTDVDLNAFRETWTGAVDPLAWQIISQTHAILARAGQPFGYRTLSEMLRYLERAHGVLAPMRALDQQLKQKVLPKLRGEETPRLRRALNDLLALALGHDPGPRAAAIPPETITNAILPESAEKLRRMLERLDADGFTDFYG